MVVLLLLSMTQEYAAKFTAIKSQLNQFILWIEENQLNKRGYKAEDVTRQIDSLCRSTALHIKSYRHQDYKVKFIEWIINFITRELAALDSGKKKSETTRIALIIDTVRIEFKNRFEHELVDYPFVFENVRYIHWKWSYREILMILYSFKELGAFNESSQELDMSNLKDLIYRFGFADWQHVDLESSWKHTQTAWRRIMDDELHKLF
ncbi:MAG: hypothetical protein LW704_11320 [Cryomorphaceae bacterium]|nr:hypothetical protein [Cryomorphaceae bacterium]